MPRPDDGETYAHGGACKHCGGELGEDGFAAKMHDGGEVSAAIEGITDEPVEQGVAAERLREAAFADALSRRRRSGP